MSEITLQLYAQKTLSEQEFKSKSFDDKWKIYNNLVQENNVLIYTHSNLASTNILLSNENAELKNKNNTLFKQLENENQLKERINELIEENLNLKEQILRLNEHVDKQDKIIEEQKIEIKDLRDEIVVIKKESNEMSTRISNLESKDLYNKYIIAIQDLNRINSLETKIGTSSHLLIKLRKNRVSECHYLDDSDDVPTINEKINVLNERLNKMPHDVTLMMNKKYPHLVPKILPFAVKTTSTLSKSEIYEINEWWDE